MASSDFLRKNLNQHTIKNSFSKGMDKDIDVAVGQVVAVLSERYPELVFEHQKRMKIVDIIAMLSRQYPEHAKHFGTPLATSFIAPDGGFLFATNKQGERRIILVSEVKRQGTNDARKLEGLPKQAKGNAIERLGKNLIGIRAIFKNEGVLPFVCFGSGHDFSDGSSILDRVLTMNEFFPLNEMFVEKNFLPFEPASMLFRYEGWTIDEMSEKLLDVAVRAIEYKFV
ncbi:MAG TPA: EcoRI family type II restriction endonuclease [Candidatus Saccharibacteria bacterium]|nr:EcoRI family type II restriction endonuclease [Candidatus Saccharibacteria bacterium]